MWAVIKTACSQGREILHLRTAAGGMRSVREHKQQSLPNSATVRDVWNHGATFVPGRQAAYLQSKPLLPERQSLLEPSSLTESHQTYTVLLLGCPCIMVLLRSLCSPVSGLEQISRKTQDSPLKFLHMTQSENRSYRLQDSPAANWK